MKGKIDLETVDPNGRFDVLTYRGAEQLARLAEAKYGVKGVWDSIRPHVHDLVTKNVTGLQVPSEAKIILQLIQANLKSEGVK